MILLIFTNSKRGLVCIDHIKKIHKITKIISYDNFKSYIDKKYYLRCPKNINSNKFINLIKRFKPSIILSAGFDQIFSDNFINSFDCTFLNLHAGDLPNMRGSSPLNWALIKDHKIININIIKLNKTIDGGDIIQTKKININENTTIKELHEEVNFHFPKMINLVLNKLKKNKIKMKKQKSTYSYYPKRFKDDGFILFDQNTAQQIHNKIRALSDPYPNAFSFFNTRKINFIKSIIPKNNFYGEPGRIYQVKKNKILVSATDKALWIYTNFNFKKTDRYKNLSSIRDFILQSNEN